MYKSYNRKGKNIKQYDLSLLKIGLLKNYIDNVHTRRKNTLISVEEALKIVIEEANILETETTDLLSSLKKVLAEDVYSKDNLPPFNKSAMDGYAIKSEDTIKCSMENSLKLKIKGIIKAGDFCKTQLQQGEAYKIMTGAPIPKGADAVIKIEKVEASKNEIFIFHPVKKNENILKLGEEIKEGTLAIPKGNIIRPAEIGILSSLGYSTVKTFKVPKISLIITGDELIDVTEDLSLGKVRNCNEYSLSALIKNLNSELKSYGIIKDRPEIIFNKMKEAFEYGDIVISSGGVSVGDYDFIEMILNKIGAEIKFSTVAIKPGKPITFATYKNKLFFGLPGNPLAVINTFEQFVSPAIKKMMGRTDIIEEEFPVILTNDLKSSKGRTNYVYVNIKKENGIYYAYTIGSQSSNRLVTIGKANGVVIIDKDTSIVKAGDVVNGKFIFK